MEYREELGIEGERQVGQMPRYENEDTRPTSKRELMGWYCYGIAAEVFAVCGVGMSVSFSMPGQWFDIT